MINDSPIKKCIFGLISMHPQEQRDFEGLEKRRELKC